jgi:hypothetical protein
MAHRLLRRDFPNAVDEPDLEQPMPGDTLRVYGPWRRGAGKAGAVASASVSSGFIHFQGVLGGIVCGSTLSSRTVSAREGWIG